MPKPAVQTEQTYIRYSPELRDRIDDWRAQHRPPLTRADAIRRLVMLALSDHPPPDGTKAPKK